ncbi:MAG TPA: OmpA family protein [Paludibacteraceae bacterium]|nr:OmpA family protein [Paludibacteraceae bacterium]HRU63056.1 OmpA family protein [Paludibacteraceae bacterium]
MLMVGAIAYTSAQQAEAPKTPDVSHWSAGIKAGIDYYRVAPGSGVQEYRFFSDKHPSWARYADNAGWMVPEIVVEYTFNPLFGLGFDFAYLTYNRQPSINNKIVGAKGNTLDFTLYGSANLLNLLVPKRGGFWGKVNVYGNLGGGLGFYCYDITNGPTTNDKRAKSPLATAGLNAEYRLSRVLSLGLEGQYRYYVRENLGGQSVNSIGCDALLASIGLRYKFTGKDKTHVRDVSVSDFYPAPAPVVIQKVEQKETAPEVLNRIKAIEDDNATIKAKLQKLESDMQKLSQQPSDVKLPQQPSDVKLSQQPSGVVSATFQNIEFEFGTYNLTKQATDILDQIYLILQNNPSWTSLTISGHTDNIGSKAGNQKISELRAQAVKDYLVKKGIPASKIKVVGYGGDKPIASNNTPEGRQKNRRVEFEISK